MAADPFDQLMASADPAMIVVTAAADDDRSGCLVGFHSQSSMDPHGYAVWISKANHTYGVVLRSTHLAVHFLADTEDGRRLAKAFGTRTGDRVDKFDRITWRRGPQGVPILAGCDHGLVGRKISTLDDGGDHVTVTLDPVEVWSRQAFTPLRLSAVQDLDPAHDADEHPDHPR
ncbi:MAG: flavin reductase domain protein FMN-binding protein [Ilumatobacteraceae bacterium]|nr:flavin reductase domain protein FMN-binding protein [Ilumatobacteraceae bacterium]